MKNTHPLFWIGTGGVFATGIAHIMSDSETSDSWVTTDYSIWFILLILGVVLTAKKKKENEQKK